MKPKIRAKVIKIGKKVTFGRNVVIDVAESFEIGDRSHIGSNSKLEGRNIKIGSDLWNSGGLRVGPGRKNWPDANLFIGNYCTNHNNFIDLADEVCIEDNVGLSPETTIYNHGHWLSVLQGFPVQKAPVKICNDVLIGYRCTILPGVTIGPKTVVGAGSIIVKSLKGGAIYAGNPAKLIRKLKYPNLKEKREIIEKMLDSYSKVCAYRSINLKVKLDYPVVCVNKGWFNVELLTVGGKEDRITDDFRDFALRYGLRFYTQRPFRIYEKT